MNPRGLILLIGAALAGLVLFTAGLRAMPSRERPRSDSVTATMASGLTTSASTLRPCVLMTIVCPEISAPGPWPVCSVVTPRERTHSTSGSTGSYASTARSSGCSGADFSSWSWSN